VFLIKSIEKGQVLILKRLIGDLWLLSKLFCFGQVLEISGGGKGSDEEHITYSGGTKIKDLGQCGWGEKKDEENKKINRNMKM